MSKAKEAFIERERKFEVERRIKEREEAEDAKRRRDIRDAMLRQRDIDNPPPQPRYRPRTPSPDWNPPEEESEVEEGEEELVADLSFFPAEEEVPGWGEEHFEWALDGVSLDPSADLPAVSASQFAEIAGIMEDARQDQVVGAIAVDDDFWIEDDSEEEDSDVWEGDFLEEMPPEVPMEERRMIHIPQREVVPKRREKPFSKATGEMRGRNPNRLGWRFPRKPYGSHRRLLPIVNISREEERRYSSEVPRRVLVQSILDWAKDNNVRFRPSITREHKGQILAEIRKYSIPVPRLSGGYYGDGKPSAHKDGEDIDFERMKWGSFTKQARREGYDDLGRFAREVLANPKKYYSTTRRRAHFYLNVLEPETVGRGGGKICSKTGKLGCVCDARRGGMEDYENPEDTVRTPRGTGKTGGKLGAVGDPSLLESKRENPVVEDVITDPMDDKDIRHYYPKAPILKYSDLANYSTIEQLLPADKSMIFLLYQHSYNNGHWVLLTRYAPNTFEFFCSYGSAIDEPLTWTREDQREALGEGTPYLTNMLKKWKGKIAVNRKQFQQKGNSVATCGAYCVMRTACLKNDNMNLVDFQHYLESLKRETGLSYDEVVANFVSHR
jgi:hypothetical protein